MMFMNINKDVNNIKELYFWSNLREDWSLNPAAAEVRKNKQKIAVFDRAWSPVYRTRRAPPGPIKAQTTYFYLTPLPPIPHTDEKDDALTQSKKPVDEKDDFDKTITESNARCVSRQRETDVRSSPCTPLPCSPHSQRQGKLLLRKPTAYKAEPLKRDDYLFDAYVKTTELKILKFDKIADSYRFYRSNYPLLLRKEIDQDRRSSSPTRRTPSTESPVSAMIQRKLELNERLTELESMVDDMEKATEPDDVKFQTELRSSVFDPTSWPFTKIDQAGMMRRYTMEAMFRDIK